MECDDGKVHYLGYHLTIVPLTFSPSSTVVVTTAAWTPPHSTNPVSRMPISMTSSRRETSPWLSSWHQTGTQPMPRSKTTRDCESARVTLLSNTMDIRRPCFVFELLRMPAYPSSLLSRP